VYFLLHTHQLFVVLEVSSFRNSPHGMETRGGQWTSKWVIADDVKEGNNAIKYKMGAK